MKSETIQELCIIVLVVVSIIILFFLELESTSVRVTLIATVVVAWATVYLALITSKAAKSAEKAANETGRASQANLVRAFLEEHSSKEMGENLRELGKVPGAHENNNLLRDMNRLANEAPGSINFTDAHTNLVHSHFDKRRRIHKYYYKIWSLFDAGYIDESAAKLLAMPSDLDILLNVVKPMTLYQMFVTECNKDTLIFQHRLPRHLEMYKFFQSLIDSPTN